MPSFIAHKWVDSGVSWSIGLWCKFWCLFQERTLGTSKTWSYEKLMFSEHCEHSALRVWVSLAHEIDMWQYLGGKKSNCSGKLHGHRWYAADVEKCILFTRFWKWKLQWSFILHYTPVPSNSGVPLFFPLSHTTTALFRKWYKVRSTHNSTWVAKFYLFWRNLAVVPYWCHSKLHAFATLDRFL